MNNDEVSTPEPQLWVVTGIDPVTWAVPFWAILKRSAEVWPSMALSDYQRKIVFGKLGEKDRLPSGRWKLSISQLRRIAHPASQVAHPEEHFVWERARRNILTEPAKRNRADRDEFLSLMYLRGIGKSEGELEYWLNAFCNAFLWHLINKETPIDLYFLKLHPSPFLDGWHTKLCVITKEWRGHAIRKPEVLHHPRLIAFDGKACLRGVELELTRTWFRLMRRVELDRVGMLQRTGYATEYRAWVERQTAELLRLHDQWNTHRLAASASISRSNRKGLPVFDHSKTRQKSRNARNGIAQAAGQPALWKKLAEQRKRIRGTNQGLREMYDRGLRFKNMRAARRFLHRSNSGKTTTGMRMLQPLESTPQVGDLLAEKPGDAGRGLA